MKSGIQKIGKIIARIVFGLIVFLGLFILVWIPISGWDVVYRNLRFGTTRIDDFTHYLGRELLASENPFQFENETVQTGFPVTVPYKEEEWTLDKFLESSDTIAFLMLKDGELRYERYFQGHKQDSLSQAFSASKSITSILIGTAIDDKYIESADQVVTDFVPELADNGFDQVPIEDLLYMRSGMAYVENDIPFGIHVLFNYTSHLEDAILDLEMRKEYTKEFIYKTGDNALLGLILDRALGDKTITEYTQERLWTPLGMEDDGVWTLDHEGDGLEKTWCCLVASARDFAKFGQLYLNRGMWNGQQIVSEEWVEQSTVFGAFDSSTWPQRFVDLGLEGYGYQWWLVSEEIGDFFAWGKDGQFIYVNPTTDVVIVRLGWSMGNPGSGPLGAEDWVSIFTYLAQEVK